MKFRVGDRVTVKGKRGVGVVAATRNWIETVKLMSDLEAKMFVADLKMRFGLKFEETWQHVYVVLGKRSKWFEHWEIEQYGKVQQAQETAKG